jgi:hypothetical protein
MGIFSSLKSAAIDANEEAHGVRLERELADTMAAMGRMHDSLRPQTLMDYLKAREGLRVLMKNWSRDGCLSVARNLLEEARKEYDLNIAKSYALWMTSAWLESAVRNSNRARAVHEHLEGLARELLSNPEVANEVKKAK